MPCKGKGKGQTTMADVENNGGCTGAGWVAGKSGNPGGRPKGIASKAREHADKCIQVLSDALADEDTKTRIAAAKELLDRGFGKAITMSADVTNRLDDLDDDTLDAGIDALRAAIAAAGAVDGGEGKPISH